MQPGVRHTLLSEVLLEGMLLITPLILEDCTPRAIARATVVRLNETVRYQ